MQRWRFRLVSGALLDHSAGCHAGASTKAKVLPGTFPLDVRCPRRVPRASQLTQIISNTTAYPRSYSFGGPPSIIYPFQSNLARIDTAVVFVTKYSREGYDLTDLKVSLSVIGERSVSSAFLARPWRRGPHQCRRRRKQRHDRRHQFGQRHRRECNLFCTYTH